VNYHAFVTIISFEGLFAYVEIMVKCNKCLCARSNSTSCSRPQFSAWQPKLEPYANINNDTAMDIYDALLLAANYGRTSS